MFCRKGQPIHFRQNFLYAGKCQKTSAFVFFSCSQRLRTRINPLARPGHDGSSPAYYNVIILCGCATNLCCQRIDSLSEGIPETVSKAKAGSTGESTSNLLSGGGSDTREIYAKRASETEDAFP